MVDNLVKRLRDPAFGTETTERNLMSAAADRIEQLAAINEELEAKLAKAVEAIEIMQDASDAMMLYIARTTLAELKGQTDDT
jgi:uncharacterized protein (UPF0147 family)